MRLLVLACCLVAITKAEEVCYDELGCFSSGPPFFSLARLISVPPVSPDKIQTKFLLYTSRDFTDNPVILDARKTKEVKTTWPEFKAKPTKFVIHGFYDDPSVDYWMKSIAEAFLQKEDCNAIVVDWSGGNKMPYQEAVANTRVVGAQVALLIHQLIKEYGLTPDDFHIVGHSLGAQTAGYAGERIPGLARISGLDPASPFFSGTDKVVRLDPTDAKFVDVIHTDALFLSLGMKQRVGHMDFYPNLGREQPGCSKDISTLAYTEHFFNDVTDKFVCNHRRAYVYFRESITSDCKFVAYPCATDEDWLTGQCDECNGKCVDMGYPAVQFADSSESRRLKFYLNTTATAPYCLPPQYPTQDSPTQSTPVQDTPEEDTPEDDTPADDTPADDTVEDDTSEEGGAAAQDTPTERPPVKDN